MCSVPPRRFLVPSALRRTAGWLLLCACVPSARVVGQGTPDPLAAATALVRAGHYDEAIATVRRALKAGPATARLYTVEGIALSLKGEDEPALGCFRKALAITPGFSRALQAEASILSRRRDPAVVEVLEQLLHADPQDTTAHEMLALAEAQQGKCTAALKEFAMVGPGLAIHADSLQFKAACLMQAGAFADAIVTFQQVHDLLPGDTGTLYNLAVAQFEAGDPKASAATLGPLLSRSPDIDTLLLAADVFEQEGDTPHAATLLHQAIVADPMRTDSYVRFAELCMSHESYQAGVDMVSAGIARAPRDASLYLARGLLLGGMAKYDAAEADFRLAEKNDPTHGTGSYAVGLIEKQRNNPAQALATVRASLATHPEDAQLHLLLARLLMEGGVQPYTEATAQAQEAVRLAPHLLAAHDLLASIYQESGKPALAVEQARAALALDPKDGAALYRLMRSLRATGNNEEAQAVGRQVAAQLKQSREDETRRLRYRIEAVTPSAKMQMPPAADKPSQP